MCQNIILITFNYKQQLKINRCLGNNKIQFSQTLHDLTDMQMIQMFLEYIIKTVIRAEKFFNMLICGMQETLMQVSAYLLLVCLIGCMCV